MFVSWGLGLVLGFCVGKYVIMPFNSRDVVSVGLFYFNQSHGF